MTLVERLRALVPEGVADDPKSEVIREAADRIEGLERMVARFGRFDKCDRDGQTIPPGAKDRIEELEAELRGLIEKVVAEDECYDDGKMVVDYSTAEHAHDEVCIALDEARALLNSADTASAQ